MHGSLRTGMTAAFDIHLEAGVTSTEESNVKLANDNFSELNHRVRLNIRATAEELCSNNPAVCRFGLND